MVVNKKFNGNRDQKHKTNSCRFNQYFENKQQNIVLLQNYDILILNSQLLNNNQELRSELDKYSYFQNLQSFIARTFPCFEFLYTFIKLFEIADIENVRHPNENDLIIRISYGDYIQQIQEKTFLDKFNWNKELKKYKNQSNNDSTPNSMLSNLFTDLSSEDTSQVKFQNDKSIYFLMRQHNFESKYMEYQMNRNLIFSNITRCIPLACQIKSTRLQDIIIKNIQVVNLIEDTVINDRDSNLQSQSPRLKYLKKNIHPFAVWFLINGNGFIEKKINENTKISISMLSEGSLFGEEILFINNGTIQVDQKNKNNTVIQQKQLLKNLNFEQFTLRLNSKVSNLYYMPKEKFQSSFPQIILQDVKKNFMDKIKSREEILKQKLNHLYAEIKEIPQSNPSLKIIDQIFSFEEQIQKINPKKQQNEVILLTNRINSEKQIEIDDKNQQILLQQTIKKDFDKQLLRKQEILAQQQQQQEKRARSSEVELLNNQSLDKSNFQNIMPNAKLKISNILLKRNQELSQEQINYDELNQNKQFIEDYNSYRQKELEQKKCFQSQRDSYVDQVPDEKKHLEKKIVQLMNKGFDFGYDKIKSDNKRETNIRLLSIKKGILTPKVIVQHPSIVEKYEKDILKKQQNLKSTSIIKGLDTPQFNQNDNSISQIQPNNQTSIGFYKQKSQSILQSSEENKISFCQTSRNDQSNKGNAINHESFSKSLKKIPINILQQSVDDKSTNRGNEQTPGSTCVSKLRKSASLKRTSDSFLQQYDCQMVSQFSMSQIQSQEQFDKSMADVSQNKQNNFQKQNKIYNRAQSTDRTPRMNINQISITSLHKLREDDIPANEDHETSCFGQKIPKTLNHFNGSKQNSIHNSNNQSQKSQGNFYSHRSNSTNLLEERRQSLQKGVSLYEYKEQPQLFSKQYSRSQNKSRNSLQIEQNSQILKQRSKSNNKLYSLANQIISNDKLTNQFSQNLCQQKVNTSENSLSPLKDCTQQRFINLINRDFKSGIKDVQLQNMEIKNSDFQSSDSVQYLDQKQIIQIIDESDLKYNSEKSQIIQTNKKITNYQHQDALQNSLEQHFISDQSPIIYRDNKKDFQKHQLLQIVSKKVEQQQNQSDNSSQEYYAKFIQNKNQYDVIGQRIIFQGNQNPQLQNENNTFSDESNKIKSNIIQSTYYEKKLNPAQQINQSGVRMASSERRHSRKSESVKSSPRTYGEINKDGIKNQQKMLFKILKPAQVTNSRINDEHQFLSGYSNNLQLSNISNKMQEKAKYSQLSHRQLQKTNQDFSLQQQQQRDQGFVINQQNNSNNSISVNKVYDSQNNEQSTMTFLPLQSENQIQQKVKLQQQPEDNRTNHLTFNVNQLKEKKEQTIEQIANNQQSIQDLVKINPPIKETYRAKSVGRNFPSSVRIELRDDQQKYKTQDKLNYNSYMNSKLLLQSKQKNITKLM